MKFRPLCIDYHARAQEIVATEREIHARRAALRTLPNPSPPPLCDRRSARPDPRCDDGIDSDRGGITLACEGKENQNGSIFTSNDGDVDGIRGVPNENGRECGDSMARSTEAATGSANPRISDSRRRIQSIMKMLGPAVHPSECAFRSIAPVTKGPVRGRKLPVATTKPLQELTKFHSNHVENQRNALIGSLESGRSRFDASAGDGIFSSLSKGSKQNDHDNANHDLQDTTFTDTMKILFTRSSSRIDSEGSYPDEGNELKSLIWSQHVTDLPKSKLFHLKHEPEDLTKIYRLKSLRSSATTTFANEISRSFRPELGALKSAKSESQSQRNKTRKGFALVGSANDDPGKISTKPKIDLISRVISESRKKQDYSSRLDSVPFTQFLDDQHDIDANEDENNLRSNDCKNSMQLSNSLALLEDRTRFVIQVDPDFDPLRETSPKKKRKPIHELLKPLDAMCSASSISVRLNLPARFEDSHQLSGGLSRFLLPHNKQQLEFFDKALTSWKESVTKDQSSELLLPILDSMDGASCMRFLPRKISLDADLEPPTLLPEENTKLKPDAKKSLNSSIQKLPSFSGMMPFSCSRKMSGNKKRQQRSVESSCRVSRVEPLKNVVNSSKAIFLPQNQVQTSSADNLVERNTRQSRQQKSASRALVSAVRSCLPAQFGPRPRNTPDSLPLLQGKCSTYPVALWFENDNADSAAPNPSELDAKILNLKRKTFCHNAKARSNEEGSRVVLLTGCSSRRNADSKYSYRGFLTNQLVNPSFFQHRYNTMLNMNKLCNRTSNSSDLSSQPRFHEFFFAKMAFGVFADAFTRHKSTNSKKFSKSRGAPYVLRLKTKRHGQGHIAASKATKGATNAPPEAKSNVVIGSKIEALATAFNDRLAKYSTETNCNCGADAGHVVEALGKNSLKVRGELLHLVAKAGELEDEKKTYLAELSVVNRGRVDTPKHVPFEGLGNSTEGAIHASPHQANTVDLTVPDDSQAIGKRKAPLSDVNASELASNQQNDKKAKKRKKDKKDKKKKERRKKDKKKKSKKNKRKHKDINADPFNSSQKRKMIESVPKGRIQHSNATSSNEHTVCVVVPGIPVGMTPINPPKKPEQHEDTNADPFNSSKKRKVIESVPKGRIQHSTATSSNEHTVRVALPGIPVGMTPINPPKKPETNTFEEPPAASEQEDRAVEKIPATKNKSPDSVANMNVATKAGTKTRLSGHDLGTKKRQPYQQTPQARSAEFDQHFSDTDAISSQGSVTEVRPSNETHAGNSENVFSPQSQRGKGASNSEGGEQHERTFLSNNLDTPDKAIAGPCCPPLSLLTSESFLETFGETVAELASGRWKKTLSESENFIANDVPNGIVICDFPLIDIVGVDIELSDNSAVIVQSLSSWSEGSQNGNRYGGNAASVQQGARAFLRRMVLLAGSGRYNAIHVMLCLDVEISSALNADIATLQNALFQQSGCPCEVTFEYVAPRALAASIAVRSASAFSPHHSSAVAEFISDENVQERARFLIMLVPSMTLHMALRCLGLSTSTESITDIIESGEAMQSLFSIAKSTSRELFPHKTENVMSSVCAEQLWLALNVDISHAY